MEFTILVFLPLTIPVLLPQIAPVRSLVCRQFYKKVNSRTGPINVVTAIQIHNTKKIEQASSSLLFQGSQKPYMFSYDSLFTL